jgi:hypothetical protein
MLPSNKHLQTGRGGNIKDQKPQEPPKDNQNNSTSKAIATGTISSILGSIIIAILGGSQ